MVLTEWKMWPGFIRGTIPPCPSFIGEWSFQNCAISYSVMNTTPYNINHTTTSWVSRPVPSAMIAAILTMVYRFLPRGTAGDCRPRGVVLVDGNCPLSMASRILVASSATVERVARTACDGLATDSEFSKAANSCSRPRWQCLNFLPLPHGHGSLRPI